EDEQVHTSVAADVVDDVRIDRRLRVEQFSARLERDVDLRERRDHLRHAVLENLKVVGGQALDGISLCVRDERVNLDRVDSHSKRRLLCPQDGAGEQHDDGDGDRALQGSTTVTDGTADPIACRVCSYVVSALRPTLVKSG